MWMFSVAGSCAPTPALYITTKSKSIDMGPSRAFRAGELPGNQHRRITGTTRLLDRSQCLTANPLYRVDHFAHAVAVALTTVIRRRREDGRVREGGWRQVMVGNLNLPNTPMAAQSGDLAKSGRGGLLHHANRRHRTHPLANK